MLRLPKGSGFFTNGLKKDGSRIKENGYFYKDSVTILGKKYHKNALINREVQDRYYDKFASVNPEPNDAIMKKITGRQK